MAREHEFGRALALERNFRRHRSLGARAEHGDLERLPGMRHRRFGGGRLIAAMRHAVRAFLVFAGAVGRPVRALHQFTERLGVAFAEQIARLLPPENVARGHAPRRAAIGLVPGEKIEEEVRVDKIPLFAPAQAEDFAEQLLGLSAVEEMFLVGGAFIRIARRDRHADTEVLGVIEEGGDVLGGMAVEDRGVDVHGESFGLRGLDRRYGAVEYARLTDGLIVMLTQPVEVDGEEEIRRWFEQMQLLLKQERVRAQRDELLPGDQALHDFADLAVDQRLAPGNGDHRSAALVGGVEALLDRQPAIENGIGIVDLAASDARQIAPKQRLEHEHERIAVSPQQFLLEDIGADAHFLKKRDSHSFHLPVWRLRLSSTPQLVASSRGNRNSICSCRPGRVETSTSPRVRNVSMTSSTSTSGAEAPAVIPIVLASLTHSGASSLPSAMR